MDLSGERHLAGAGGALPSAGRIIRHDAVVWGFARGADRGGAEIHLYTEVVGTSAQTGASPASRRTAATSPATRSSRVRPARSTLVADLAGVPLPITTHILQAFVTSR